MICAVCGTGFSQGGRRKWSDALDFLRICIHRQFGGHTIPQLRDPLLAAARVGFVDNHAKRCVRLMGLRA